MNHEIQTELNRQCVVYASNCHSILWKSIVIVSNIFILSVKIFTSSAKIFTSSAKIHIFLQQFSKIPKFEIMKVIKIGQKPYQCSQCDVRFNSKRNIPRHVALKHPQETPQPSYQCFYCQKVFQSKGNHDVHFEKIHFYLLYYEPEQVHLEGINLVLV